MLLNSYNAARTNMKPDLLSHMHIRSPEVTQSKVKLRHCPECGCYCPGKQKLRLLITKNIAKVIKVHGGCNQREFRYRIINHEIMISAKKEVPRFIQLISEAFFHGH